MSTLHKICNDGASKSKDDGVCEVVDKLHNMRTSDDNKDCVITNKCANCGKEGNSNDMNTCNRCKMVKYCNATCKKKHRSKHKKKCDRRVAEMHDEALFKQPPQLYGDCPICFLRMPALVTGRRYKTCCGKVICSGCSYATANINLKKQLCAFCRIPAAKTDEESVGRLNKRVEAGDTEAICTLAGLYDQGILGLRQNYTKALDLLHQAGELGHASAYHNIGCAYHHGDGVEVDERKAKHYYELAAMGGNEIARNNLGCMEEDLDNMDKAKKHWMIAAKDGYTDSLTTIQKLHSSGEATKEEYAQALQSYQEYLGEIKSDQRDEAAAYDEEYKYY